MWEVYIDIPVAIKHADLQMQDIVLTASYYHDYWH